MVSAGASTPLPRKLGIRAGDRVLVIGDPLDFDLSTLTTDDGLDRHRPGLGSYPVVLLFCPESSTLHELFDTAKAAHTPDGCLWVCWPKKASGITTDLSDGAVREHGLTRSRVDVKVAAIDAVWSGLKFVVRRSDR